MKTCVGLLFSSQEISQESIRESIKNQTKKQKQLNIIKCHPYPWLYHTRVQRLPACCFFFLPTAPPMICRSSSSEAPERKTSLKDTSEFPNKHTWERTGRSKTLKLDSWTATHTHTDEQTHTHTHPLTVALPWGCHLQWCVSGCRSHRNGQTWRWWSQTVLWSRAL